MEDREFARKVAKLKKACEHCLNETQTCEGCPYRRNCEVEQRIDTLSVIAQYEKKLWEKTAEVEKLKKELRNAKAQPPVVTDRVDAGVPLMSKDWYLSVAKFIRRNIFVEIRCDESLEDIDYVRNVLDVEAAIRAAYGNDGGKRQSLSQHGTKGD